MPPRPVRPPCTIDPSNFQQKRIGDFSCSLPTATPGSWAPEMSVLPEHFPDLTRTPSRKPAPPGLLAGGPIGKQCPRRTSANRPGGSRHAPPQGPGLMDHRLRLARQTQAHPYRLRAESWNMYPSRLGSYLSDRWRGCHQNRGGRGIGECKFTKNLAPSLGEGVGKKREREAARRGEGRRGSARRR